MDLSNKSLALLLLAAIVISLGGTIVSLNKISQVQFGVPMDDSLTGRVPGWTAVNITESVGCAIDFNVDFGEDGPQDLNLTSDINNGGAFNDCTATNTCSGMQINNTGNVDLNISFNSSVQGAALMGGSAVNNDFKFNMTNGTQPGAPTRGGCFNISGSTGWGVFQNVPIVSTQICDNLSYLDTSDIINIEYLIRVRADTPVGEKNATIEVDCDQI